MPRSRRCRSAQCSEYYIHIGCFAVDHVGEASKSEARRSLAQLVPDRRRELRERQERVASVPRLAADLQEASSYIAAAMPMDRGDFISHILFVFAVPLLDVVAHTASNRLQRLPAHIALGSVPDDETGASLRIFPDGSGRILFSDSLISLFDYFAGLTVALHDRSGCTSSDATVAVRYHILHRRMFGLSAILGVSVSDNRDRRDRLSQLAIRFVIAHEVAHFCLGHDIHSGDPTIEFEADQLALKSVLAELESEAPGTDAALALVAMRLALLVTEMTEMSIFVRAPITHPSASLRWESAIKDFDPDRLTKVAVYTQKIADVVTAASDLSYRLPEPWWDESYNSDIIRADVHDPEYYSSMRHFDLLGFGDPADPAKALMMFEEYFGIPLSQIAGIAAQSGSYDALINLGISASQAQRLCDQSRPLAFYTLLEMITQSPVVESIDDQDLTSSAMAKGISEALDAFTLRQMSSWCLATLIAGVMQGVFVRV